METTLGPWAISVRRVWPTPEAVAGRYDQEAKRWQRVLSRAGQLRAYERLAEAIDRNGLLASLGPAPEIMDCGIGTAAFSLAVAARLPDRTRISGVDLSREMLNLSRSRLQRRGLAGDLQWGDVCRLNFPDGRFDLVLCGHVLEHVPDPGGALLEIVRVMRPGASLVGSVTRTGPFGFLLQVRWLNRSFREQELACVLQRAGLKDVRVIRYRWGLPRLMGVAFVGRKPNVTG